MGRWSDLNRPPLSTADLRRGLLRAADDRLRVRVVQRTGSTNADLREAALAGAAEGEILVAEEQTAGRGRHGRTWSAPATAALTFSMLLRPDRVPVARWGWLPLLTGVAVARAVARVGEIEVGVKWPNDVLIDGCKLGGILVERVDRADAPSPVGAAVTTGAAAVVGIGLNISQAEDELPVASATSLLVAGATCVDRLPVFRAVVRGLLREYDQWVAAEGDAAASGLLDAYTAVSVTLGRDVRLELPGGRHIEGCAVALDESGALVVRTTDGRDEVLSAGEVTHLRPVESDARPTDTSASDHPSSGSSSAGPSS